MTDDHNPTPDDSEDAMAQAERIVNDAIARDGADEVSGGDHTNADGSADASGDAERDEQDADDALTRAEQKAGEHLADLQRLQAEYVNYRKRVDRDRAAAGDVATAKVVEALLPVLDDIAGAREHGELDGGPFAAIAEKLEEALGRFGWSSFGAPGEEFDPTLHEALMSQTSAEVTVPTIEHVAQPGHRIGDRVVRPARVVVTQPEHH